MSTSATNDTNDHCAACGMVLSPDRILYDANRNKFCFGCYRALQAYQVTPPTHTYPPMYYPRPPSPRPYPTYPIIWC